MLRTMERWAAVAVCSLFLGLLSAPAGHAAGTTLAQAQVTKQPSALVWMDTDLPIPAVGSGTSVDAGAAKTVQDQYAGSQWTLLLNGQVTVQSRNGRPLFKGFWMSYQQDRSFFWIHGRLGSQLVNGTIFRNVDSNGRKLSDGLATVFVSRLCDNGRDQCSLQVYVPLTFNLQLDAPADTTPFGHF